MGLLSSVLRIGLARDEDIPGVTHGHSDAASRLLLTEGGGYREIGGGDGSRITVPALGGRNIGLDPGAVTRTADDELYQPGPFVPSADYSPIG